MRSASLLRGSLRRFSNDARLRELARTAPLRVDYLNIPTTPQYQRTAAIAKIASRQTLSYDKDAVRLDEKLRDAFERNMTFAASISGTERGKLSAESDPLTAAHRFVDRCNFFSASNEELIVAFGLPIESPNSPKALFVDFTVFALAMVCIELTLAALRTSGHCDALTAGSIHKKMSKPITDAILARVSTVETTTGNQGRTTDRLRSSQAAMGSRVLHAMKAGPVTDQRIAAALWGHLPIQREWRDSLIDLRHVARMVEWVRVHLALFDALPVRAFLEGEWHFISILDPVAFPVTSREVADELREVRAQRAAEEAIDAEVIAKLTAAKAEEEAKGAAPRR